jgi:hypothetical protein
VRDAQFNEVLRPGWGQVERPGTEVPAVLDELGDADVQHTLPAGLRAADAEGKTLDQRQALTGRPRELVAVAVLLLAAESTAGSLISGLLLRFAFPQARTVSYPAGVTT